jgi:hypothetical protein
MKKCISVLVLCVLVAGGAFAVDKAIGGGLLFDYSFNGGVKYETVWQGEPHDAYDGTDNMSFGGYGFFDITYVELGLYFAYGRILTASIGETIVKANGSMTQLGFSLLGKYPIELGRITLFPALGLDYNLALSCNYEGGVKMQDSLKWMSQFGFQAGMGLDLGLTESLFLRFNGMFHMRLPMKKYKDAADAYDVKATLGKGPRVNVAIGYKL